MVQLDTELNVENISSEGKHDLFHFTYQGCSRKAQLFWILVLCCDLFSSPSEPFRIFFPPKWSDSPQNMFFMIFLFFTYYVGSSLALSVWEFMLSTSVNVSHTLALSIIFFSLLLKLPQFTYQIPFCSLPFLLFPLLLFFATFWEMCIILPSNSFDFLYHWPY